MSSDKFGPTNTLLSANGMEEGLSSGIFFKLLHTGRVGIVAVNDLVHQSILRRDEFIPSSKVFNNDLVDWDHGKNKGKHQHLVSLFLFYNSRFEPNVNPLFLVSHISNLEVFICYWT